MVKTRSHLRDPGIPGLKSNPDPGILEDKILGFVHIKQNNDFKDFYCLFFFQPKFSNKSWDKMLGYSRPKNPGMNILG